MIQNLDAPLAQSSAGRGLLRPALISAVFFMLLAGIAYPLLTTWAAQLLFPYQAGGSLVQREGKTVGSAQIGQDFGSPAYFQPRPSATTGPDPANHAVSVTQPYNAALSGASNLGPTNGRLLDEVSARARAYRQKNGLDADALVPVDAVTASGSGLDPDISLANAYLQAARVAKVRGMAAPQIVHLVDQQASMRQFGVLGEPRINVLALNLALDELAAAHRTAR